MVCWRIETRLVAEAPEPTHANWNLRLKLERPEAIDNCNVNLQTRASVLLRLRTDSLVCLVLRRLIETGEISSVTMSSQRGVSNELDLRLCRSQNSQESSGPGSLHPH